MILSNLDMKNKESLLTIEERRKIWKKHFSGDQWSPEEIEKLKKRECRDFQIKKIK